MAIKIERGRLVLGNGSTIDAEVGDSVLNGEIGGRVNDAEAETVTTLSKRVT